MKNHDLTLSRVVLDGEFQQFQAAIPSGDSPKDRRESLMMWVLINTGIRVSELCSLRVKDTPAALGGLFIEVHLGKGGKSRNVPVSARLANDIDAYIREVRPQTLPQRYARDSLDGWLFFNRRKRKYTRQQVYLIVRRIARKAGITKAISPHCFRHRFATRTLDKNGKNLIVVKVLLGHASVATTEKYLHLVELANREYGELLDQRNP
jgi:integrase/recombinase XerD